VLFRQLIDDRTAPAPELVVPSGPVIILTATDERCDALVVAGPDAEIRHIPLPGVTEELVMAQANRLLTGPAADRTPSYIELQRLRAGALEVLTDLHVGAPEHLDSGPLSVHRRRRPVRISRPALGEVQHGNLSTVPQPTPLQLHLLELLDINLLEWC
jgi:hypothetical protein